VGMDRSMLNPAGFLRDTEDLGMTSDGGGVAMPWFVEVVATDDALDRDWRCCAYISSSSSGGGGARDSGVSLRPFVLRRLVGCGGKTGLEDMVGVRRWMRRRLEVCWRSLCSDGPPELSPTDV
jgi:hypothetical protein